MRFDETDIRTFDEELNPQLVVDVLKDMKARGFQFGWHSNKGVDFSHWNINYAGSKRARVDVFPRLPPCVQLVWAELKEMTTQLRGHRVIRSYINAMTFGTEGYIHTDSKVDSDLSIVVYLNPEWHAGWAGETVFLDGEGDLVKSVLPRFGRVVIFPGAMEHAARGVSRICPEARYVLVFKTSCD